MMSDFGRWARSLRAIHGTRAELPEGLPEVRKRRSKGQSGRLPGAAALSLAALAACGGDEGPPRVATVSIAPSPATVVQGASVALTATPRDGSGGSISGLTATWQSNNSSIASVNTTTGVVTGVSTGSTTVRATISGVNGIVTVNVTPPPVTSVSITPPAPVVPLGSTLQLTAVLRDATGNLLTGRSVSWTSATQAVATIDASSGLVTGVTTGTSLITATSEGVGSTVTLTVTGTQSNVAVTAITPDPLVAGATATITGTGFSSTLLANTVTIGGTAATVTAATETSLTVSLPNSICLPTGNTVVRVAVGSQSGQRTHPFQSSVAPLNVAVGQQLIITDPANFCLHIPARATPEFLVVGVQSVQEVPSSLTPVVVRGAVAAGSSPATTTTTTATATAKSAEVNGLAVPSALRSSVLRRNRHRQAELSIRTQDQEIARAPRVRTADAQIESAAMAVPGTTQLGDTVSIRVPNRTSLCSNPANIRAVVRHVGAHAFWVEDIANPTGGFTPGDFQNLGQLFDDQVWNTDTNYFGMPSDRDSNSRIVIVVTREINRSNNILGFVSSGDFQPATCPASNNGEYFYGIAPDPTGTLPFGVFDLDDARAEWPILIAHEFTHIIQFSRRLQSGPLQSIWEIEGQATLAEEVVGHAVIGNQPRQNLGANVAINREPGATDPTHPVFWYISAFADLLQYFGWDGTATAGRVPGAPEQCTWLQSSTSGALGPCLGSRSIYGVSWSFLRWVSDQFGPSFPGGEQGLQRALVTSSDAGFANISNRVNQPIETMLAQWAASLYVDDLLTSGLDPKLTMPSWNMLQINNLIIQGNPNNPLGLRPYLRQFTEFNETINVRGGSSAYYRMSATTSHQATAVSFTSPSGSLPAGIRLWVVRLQ
jgi:hypothetical protein